MSRVSAHVKQNRVGLGSMSENGEVLLRGVVNINMIIAIIFIIDSNNNDNNNNCY